MSSGSRDPSRPPSQRIRAAVGTQVSGQVSALLVDFNDQHVGRLTLLRDLLDRQLVGEALQPLRDQVVIATKFGFNIVDGKHSYDFDYTLAPQGASTIDTTG